MTCRAEKRIKELGLSRKGCAVQYSAISEDVQAAIEVYIIQVYWGHY